MEPEPRKIDWRVRAVERYVVTRYTETDTEKSSVERGTFASPYVAHEVAHCLAKEQRDRLGWLPGDERLTFPAHPIDEPLPVTR